MVFKSSNKFLDDGLLILFGTNKLACCGCYMVGKKHHIVQNYSNNGKRNP